jgi:RNA polymerase sigma-70 factor (ECF subfamily)
MYHSNDPSAQQKRLDDHLDFQRLDKALSKMPLTYREAIVLRYHEELSMRDLAAALNISLSAAKMRVSRGLEMLRQMVKGMDNER